MQNETMKTQHASHVHPMLKRMVLNGHITSEKAELISLGFTHLPQSEVLRAYIAMGDKNGDNYRIEVLSEYDWRVLRSLILERKVEIVEILGIQYLCARDMAITRRFLKELGLVE